MRYGKKIIVWHECYVKGGSDWSIIDILTNWPNKNDNFDFFVNRKHQGIKLLKKYLNKKSKFNFYDSVIEKLKRLEKNKIFFNLLKISIIRKLIGIWLLIFSFFNINKKIQNKKSDFILINNGGYPGGLSSYIVIISAFLLNKKIAMIIRNYPPCNYKKSLTMIITKLIVQKFNCKIIAVSKSLKKSLVTDGGLQKEKIEVIYNGISIQNKKKIQSKKKIKINKLSVGIFGRLEHRKGHHLLISSWKKIQKKIPRIFLYIVGDGDNEYVKKLKFLIKKENLNEKKIIWINYTNNIYKIMSKIDLVIVPSINFESFGRVAVEAMAFKKPLITSNFGGLKEVNKNNKTGLVLKVNNRKILENKIIELMNNKNKRNYFGNNGFINFKKNFTSKIMANNYYQFIKKEIIK
jgi:glycosyltransferase involved in cell wall biosynthesis